MSNTTSQPFTEKYFLEEVVRLRREMGTKTFWQRPREQREAFLQGLAFVCLNIDNEDGTPPTGEQLEKWARIYKATTDEYNRRELYATAGI